MRTSLALLLLAACRPDPSADYLQRELTYLQGYVASVDPEREAVETRRVLAQRRLRVVDTLREPGWVALGARQTGGPLSAVRVITRRGVVLGVDGDLSAPLAPSEVELARDVPRTLDTLSLVGVGVRQRDLELGCLRLFRVLEDGRAVEQRLDVGALGSRACVTELRAVAGHVFAVAAFPGLAHERVPQLPIELELEPVPLGQPDPLVRRFVLGLERGWITRAASALAASPLVREPTFSARHALGVARAALEAAQGRGAEAQRAAYLAALSGVPEGRGDAAVVADTLAHIARGWLDPSELPAAADAPPVAAPEPELPREPGQQLSEPAQTPPVAD